MLLVNCYVSYCTHLSDNGVSKKQILSQYEFRKAIALAWIDPRNYWKTNERKRSYETEPESSIGTRSSKKAKNKKATYVTDDSFGPHGNMSNRMSRNVEHQFEFASKHSRCAIHRWATNRKVSLHNNVYFCPACNVCVCITCHKLLRNEKNLLEMKKELEERFLKEQEDRKLCRTCSPTSDARAEMGRLSRDLKPKHFSAI